MHRMKASKGRKARRRNVQADVLHQAAVAAASAASGQVVEVSRKGVGGHGRRPAAPASGDEVGGDGGIFDLGVQLREKNKGEKSDRK